MLIVMIIILRCLSWAIGFFSTGVSSLIKINSRLKDEESIDFIKSGSYLKPLETIKYIIDILMYLLLAILPIVFILEIVVYFILVATIDSIFVLYN